MNDMGKAALKTKGAIASPVKLEPLEFWKFRSVVRDAEVIVAQAQAAVTIAITQRDTYVAELAKKYGFNPKATTWQWNDETCEISGTVTPQP